MRERNCLNMPTMADFRYASVAAAIASIAATVVWRSRLLQRRFPVPKPHESAVLITGVNGGLGSAFATDLAKQGYLVIGTVRKQLDADALKAAGIIHPVLLDVSNADAFDSAVLEVREMLEQKGRTLSVLVNNAGITGMDKT